MAEARKQILIFYMDAGGGHRAAAKALAAAAEERGLPFEMRLVSLREVLAPLDFVKRWRGLSMEETYNDLVRRGRTRHLVPMLRLLHGYVRVRHKALVRCLAAEIARHAPAAVVSVLPNFNAALRDAVAERHPGAPFVLALTDFADFPPHFWIEPGIDRVIVGSDHAVEQALKLGIPRGRVSRTSGMPLHPRFYRGGGPEARARVRQELGFVDEDFVVLLLFGGKGAPEIEPLAAQLLSAPAAFRVIAVCGDNPALFERLAPLETRGRGRLQRFGFTDRVAELMAASDLLATKPGPGSLAEAFHHRLPLVVCCAGRIIPQERWNARLLRDGGLGLVVACWREMPEAIATFVRDEGLRSRTRRNLGALPENRAVFEILEILAREIVTAEALAPESKQAAS